MHVCASFDDLADFSVLGRVGKVLARRDVRHWRTEDNLLQRNVYAVECLKSSTLKLSSNKQPYPKTGCAISTMVEAW